MRVTRSLVLCICFVDRCLYFCTFSFDHCVVCSSLIYEFWLPLWYLQTLLKLTKCPTLGLYLKFGLYKIPVYSWFSLDSWHCISYFYYSYLLKRQCYIFNFIDIILTNYYIYSFVCILSRKVRKELWEYSQQLFISTML